MISTTTRVIAIDQLRGYAIFGMVLVNSLGIFDAMPWVFKHHREGYSYADTIAPLFVFVVGMGFRISLPRRVAADGRKAAYLHAARRYGLLMVLGLLYGGFDLKVGIWDALMDIGCAGFLALPFLERSMCVRVLAGCVYLVLYEAVFRLTGYGAWALANTINGGPLGTLSYTLVILLGTVAWDIVATGERRRILTATLGLGAVLVGMGWLFGAAWGEFKPFWPFSQYAMTSPYVLYSTGLCFLTLAAFYLLCDIARVRLPHLGVLGKNPLVLYLIQAGLCILIEVVVRQDAPMFIAFAAFLMNYGVVYTVGRALDRRGIILKL
ncbi:MAG TPA: heparan-alpha-glucosaminide N-acetyltransferase domain-containing protein [Candidatus Hydrogenedentes bacterium]|nr:heparan-alpha-glucosaminide N-acetyltransferase domain-containing protein [Candidatus Hydrogenedentota bacterium]